MAQMTKNQRIERIQDLVADEASLTREEIVEKVVEESGVTEKTVNLDLDNLFPDGLPDVTPEDDDQAPVADEVAVVVDLSGEASTSVSDSLIAKPQARAAFVPEVQIGRIKPEDYEVDPKEKGQVIIQAERTNFNQVTGKKKSRPETLKCNTRQWSEFSKQLPSLGYSWAVVLHAPAGIDANWTIQPPTSAQ